MKSILPITNFVVCRKNQLPLPMPYPDLVEPLLTLAGQVGDAPVIEQQNIKDKKLHEECQGLILLFVEALYKSMM